MEARQMLGERGLIDRGQFVRLILESLHSLGYADVADELEEESGIRLIPLEYHQLGHLITSGRWEDCIRIIETKECFEDLSPKNRSRACFFIWKQCFLELLASQDTDAGRRAAIPILQHRIAPLAEDREVNSLALSIITSDPSHKLELIQKRGELLEDVVCHLPKWVRVPERRLEHLVEMASVGQQKRCLYHNMPIGEVTLFEDHWCSYKTIPWQCSQTLNDHKNEVLFLKFSNNGLYLASTCSGRSMIIWQVEENTDRVLMTHNTRDNDTSGPFIAWSPDDTQLVTFGRGEFLKLWNVETGTCTTIPLGPLNCIANSCAWLPDSRSVVWGTCEPETRVYTMGLEGVLHEHLEGESMQNVSDIAVTPDGQHLISIHSDSFIRIRNLQTREMMDIRESGSITSLSLSGDGRHLIVNLGSEEIHLWSVRSPHNPPEIYRGHKQAIRATRCCFGGSNSMFIASGSEDSLIYIWHRGDYDKPVWYLKDHLMAVNCVSWNPSKPYMLASASADRTIRIWMDGIGQDQ